MDDKTKGMLWNEAMLRWLSGRIKTMNDLCVWLHENNMFKSNIKKAAFIHYADQYDMDNYRICGKCIQKILRRHLEINEDGFT